MTVVRPTAEEIESAKTANGGWTKDQLAQWGIGWPPPKGWRAALMTSARCGQPLCDHTDHKYTNPARILPDATGAGEARLHYVDPPYVFATRSDGGADYAHELTEADHVALLEFLKTLAGTVILSGYPHPLYDKALVGWRRVERAALADGAKKRTEVIWINRESVAAQADLLIGEAA